MKKQSGLTLIELIIVVVIVGIMASVAAPNLGGIMSRSKLKTSYNNFVGTVATARSEAANRSATISMCASSANGGQCGNGTWTDGYLVFVDADSNGTYQAASGDLILKKEPAATGITITSAEYVRSLSIRPRGRLRTEATFVFCSSDGNAKALNLWVTGLGRMATDSDGDGTVEGVDGTPVDCP